MRIMEIFQHLKQVDTTIKETFNMPSNYFFAGGVFKSLVNDEPVNDYDIFFYERTRLAGDFIREASRIRDSRDGNFVKEYTIKFGNKNIKVQFITKECFGTPEEVIERFDFEHTKLYYNPNTEESNLTPDKTVSMRSKQLQYSRGHQYPVKSLWRAFKFIGQGWTLGNEDFIEILKDISGLNLNHEQILEQQSLGLYGSVNHLISVNEQINGNNSRRINNANQNTTGTTEARYSSPYWVDELASRVSEASSSGRVPNGVFSDMDEEEMVENTGPIPDSGAGWTIRVDQVSGEMLDPT